MIGERKSRLCLADVRGGEMNAWQTNLKGRLRGGYYFSGIWISALKKSMRNADWQRWHLAMMSLPLACVFQCLFTFARISGNLTAQSMGSHRDLEVEFKFQRCSCKLSFLFPPYCQSAPVSLLTGYLCYWDWNTRLFISYGYLPGLKFNTTLIH